MVASVYQKMNMAKEDMKWSSTIYIQEMVKNVWISWRIHLEKVLK